jgi:ribonuclease HI
MRVTVPQHPQVPSWQAQRQLYCSLNIVCNLHSKAVNLIKKNWKIEFKWVKAHVGIYGNEMADRLAKEVNKNQHETYSRIPKCAIIRENRQQSIRKWQSQWEETTKGAVTKEFFPSVEG